MIKPTSMGELDRAQRIVVPSEVREVMGWEEKTPLEIWIDPTDSKLVIKKHHKSCIFCGREEGLKEYKKLYVCPSCRKSISIL